MNKLIYSNYPKNAVYIFDLILYGSLQFKKSFKVNI